MIQSEYIAYFDESGDHGMEKIDAEFPVFVLCGCVFKISDYLTRNFQISRKSSSNTSDTTRSCFIRAISGKN
jgi:hypothetical protein